MARSRSIPYSRTSSSARPSRVVPASSARHSTVPAPLAATYREPRVSRAMISPSISRQCRSRLPELEQRHPASGSWIDVESLAPPARGGGPSGRCPHCARRAAARRELRPPWLGLARRRPSPTPRRASAPGIRRCGRPQTGASASLHVPLEHAALADAAQVASPRPRRGRAAGALEHGADRCPCRAPHARAAPAARERGDLGLVGAPQRHRHVDQVAEPAELVVRPGVRREHQRMLRGRERGDAVDAEPARNRARDQLVGGRCRDADRPVRPGVQLDRERQPRPLERAQVVGDATALGLARPSGSPRRASAACAPAASSVSRSRSQKLRRRGRGVVERHLGRPCGARAARRTHRARGRAAGSRRARGPRRSPRRGRASRASRPFARRRRSLEQLHAMQPQRLPRAAPSASSWSTWSHISVQPQRPVAVLARQRRAEGHDARDQRGDGQRHQHDEDAGRARASPTRR